MADPKLPDFRPGLAGANGDDPATPLAVSDKYIVAPGVAIEELDNSSGGKRLRDEIPAAVKEILERKDALDVYNRFVATVVDEKRTRSALTDTWRSMEFVAVIDLFREEFAEKGIKVAFCKRKSSAGTHRWLEFIDVDALQGPYVPQYDVANYSGQVIKTIYTTLEFPNGVAVEDLKKWGKARKKLKEKIPPYVEDMMLKHDLMEQYNALVSECAESGMAVLGWNTNKLMDIINRHRPEFECKGVGLFLSHKQEWVSHGQYGGHVETFRWIEFVDKEQQPNYLPQRDTEIKKESCVIA